MTTNSPDGIKPSPDVIVHKDGRELGKSIQNGWVHYGPMRRLAYIVEPAGPDGAGYPTVRIVDAQTGEMIGGIAEVAVVQRAGHRVAELTLKMHCKAYAPKESQP